MSEHGSDHFSRTLAGRINSGEFDAWFRPTEFHQRRTEGQTAFFLLLAEVVRDEHDPVMEWEAFCEQLWAWTDAAFGGTPHDQSWPEDLPSPWWLHLDDPPSMS